jgi:hypothetical protein
MPKMPKGKINELFSVRQSTSEKDTGESETSHLNKFKMLIRVKSVESCKNFDPVSSTTTTEPEKKKASNFKKSWLNDCQHFF